MVSRIETAGPAEHGHVVDSARDSKVVRLFGEIGYEAVKKTAGLVNMTPYQAVCPPSITKFPPVIKLLASLAKNCTAPLNSFVSANLPIIFSASHFSLSPGTSSKFFLTIGVSICPGLIQFTLIPPVPSSCLRDHSIAKFLANWITAALLLLYTGLINP